MGQAAFLMKNPAYYSSVFYKSVPGDIVFINIQTKVLKTILRSLCMYINRFGSCCFVCALCQTESLFWPVFVIATLGAMIASQAMISATFSCVKQSMALGCFPRLKIIHTSRKFMGQIYIPVINWFLMIMCIVVVSIFKSTTDIANAYGNVSTISSFHIVFYILDMHICFMSMISIW